ncbi:MAG: lysophospholipase L1-like esterase [Cognaticolwellia sp.]|jgi:lysophospholipase L1-like esterase
MPSPKTWLARGLLLTLSTIGALIACEALARRIAPTSVAGIRAAESWDADCIQAKDGPGYGWRPGHCGSNAAGFLGSERPMEKDPDTFRVVVLGDSISGDGRTARWLEEMLIAKLNRPVEVLNFGVFGYNPTNELAVWQTQAKHYKPDVVIHQFCVNDYKYTPLFFEQDGQLMSAANQNGQLNHVPTVLYQRSALLRWGLALQEQSRVLPSFAEREPAIRDAIQTLDAELKAAGVPWISVLFPYLADPDQWREEDLQATQSFLALLEELQVPALDLGPAFQAVGAENLIIANSETAMDKAQQGTLQGLSPVQLAHLLSASETYFPKVIEQNKEVDRIHPNAIGHFLAAWHLLRFLAPYSPQPKPVPEVERHERRTRTPADR